MRLNSSAVVKQNTCTVLANKSWQVKIKAVNHVPYGYHLCDQPYVEMLAVKGGLDSVC